MGIRIGSLTALLFVMLTGCGGGSSAPPAIPSLDGTWRGNLTLVQDMCANRTNPFAALHQVSIAADQVSVLANDGRTYTGTATSANGFTVEIVDNTSFPVIDRIAYADIANGRAQVTISHIWSRPGGCVTTWTGEMRKD